MKTASLPASDSLIPPPPKHLMGDTEGGSGAGGGGGGDSSEDEDSDDELLSPRGLNMSRTQSFIRSPSIISPPNVFSIMFTKGLSVTPPTPLAAAAITTAPKESTFRTPKASSSSPTKTPKAKNGAGSPKTPTKPAEQSPKTPKQPYEQSPKTPKQYDYPPPVKTPKASYNGITLLGSPTHSQSSAYLLGSPTGGSQSSLVLNFPYSDSSLPPPPNWEYRIDESGIPKSDSIAPPPPSIPRDESALPPPPAMPRDSSIVPPPPPRSESILPPPTTLPNSDSVLPPPPLPNSESVVLPPPSTPPPSSFNETLSPLKENLKEEEEKEASRSPGLISSTTLMFNERKRASHGRLTLDDALDDSGYRKKLESFLEKNLCLENLKFLRAVQDYKMHVGDGKERMNFAISIVKIHLEKESPELVNLDSKTRSDLLKRVEARDFANNLFDGAYHVIYNMVDKDVFRRWLTSKEYREMATQERNSDWSVVRDEKKGVFFKKNTVTWRFSFAGEQHKVKLKHSPLGGKRVIFVDRVKMLSEKTAGGSQHPFRLIRGDLSCCVNISYGLHGVEYELELNGRKFLDAQLEF